MKYKCFVKLFIVTSVSLSSFICILLCLIDPLGIFNIVTIKGFNHYKGIVQEKYMDVWKPYEIKEKKPDIIFIGSSRVYLAIDARSYRSNYTIYNAGFSGLSIKDMDAYVDMICKMKKPKKIYIGLDLFQFGDSDFSSSRPGFSLYRLNNVAAKDNTIFLYKMHDSLSIDFKNIVNVIDNSLKNVNRQSNFINGYCNTSFNINEKGYYSTINSYNNKYKKWKYSKNSMTCLKEILKKANKNGIEVIIYFNPVSIELMSLMRIYEIDDDLEKIKRDVTSICGVVYDFNFTNEDVINKKYFIDASHVNKLFGDFIIEDLQNNKDSNRMLILTNQNIENQLKKEKCNFDNWKKENLKYYTSMEKQLKENNQEVIKGDFKEFIGF